MGSRNPNGYAFIRDNGKQIYVHRFSYQIHFGPIPAGLYICHHCDNPSCVRPDHLFLGTPQDNVDDMIRKGRMATGERLNRTSQVGSLNHCAKLTETEVAQIRELYSLGFRQKELAIAFDQTLANIWAIVHRKSWKHV